MKKNKQIFLVVVSVAKSDFLRCVGAIQILIENAERFARIDLDRSRFEKRTQTIILDSKSI